MLRSETARDLTMGAGMGDACAQGDVPARGHRSPRLLLEPLLSSPITFTPSPERLRHLEAGILKDAERHRQLEWLGEQALREYASPMPPVASQLRGSAARAGLLQPLPPSRLNERLAKAMEYNTTLEEELRSALAQVSMLQNALQLARDDSTQRVAASAAQAHEHRLRLCRGVATRLRQRNLGRSFLCWRMEAARRVRASRVAKRCAQMMLHRSIIVAWETWCAAVAPAKDEAYAEHLVAPHGHQSGLQSQSEPFLQARQEVLSLRNRNAQLAMELVSIRQMLENRAAKEKFCHHCRHQHLGLFQHSRADQRNTSLGGEAREHDDAHRRGNGMWVPPNCDTSIITKNMSESRSVSGFSSAWEHSSWAPSSVVDIPDVWDEEEQSSDKSLQFIVRSAASGKKKGTRGGVHGHKSGLMATFCVNSRSRGSSGHNSRKKPGQKAGDDLQTPDRKAAPQGVRSGRKPSPQDSTFVLSPDVSLRALKS